MRGQPPPGLYRPEGAQSEGADVAVGGESSLTRSTFLSLILTAAVVGAAGCPGESTVDAGPGDGDGDGDGDPGDGDGDGDPGDGDGDGDPGDGDGDGDPGDGDGDGDGDVVDITSLIATPAGVGPGGDDVEICWSTTGPVEGCFLYAEGGDEFFEQEVPANGCTTVFFDSAGYVGLDCFGDGYDFESLEILDAPGIGAFQASPSTLPGAGGTVALAWSTFGMTSCVLSENGAVIDADAPLSGTASIDVAEPTTFELECTDGSSNYSRSVEVDVGPSIVWFDVYVYGGDGDGDGDGDFPDFPGEDFDGDGLGRPGYVSWESIQASDCTLTFVDDEGTWVFDVAPSGGFELLAEFAEELSITLACTDGSLTDTEVVLIGNAELLTFEANPARAIDAGPVEICWEATYVDECYLNVYSFDDEFYDVVEPVGCTTVNVSSRTQAYISCYGPSAEVWGDLTIEVGPGIDTFEVSPAQLPIGGGTVEVDWDTFGMDSCSLAADGEEVLTGLSGEAEILAITDDTELTLTCLRGMATYEQTRYVVVGAGITQFVGFVTSYPYGPVVSSYLIVLWETEGLGTCALNIASPSLNATYNNQPGQSQLQLPMDIDVGETATLTLTCSGAGETDTRVIEVGPPGILSFEATPAALPAGGGVVQLCWEAVGVGSCALSSPAAGPYQPVTPLVGGLAPIGCYDVDAGIVTSTSYGLTCTPANTDFGYPAVPIYSSTYVPVGPTLLALTVEPRVVAAGGGTAEVTWEANDVDGCSVKQDGVEVGSGASGTATVNVTAHSAILLSCTAGAQSLTAEETILVAPVDSVAACEALVTVFEDGLCGPGPNGPPPDYCSAYAPGEVTCVDTFLCIIDQISCTENGAVVDPYGCPYCEGPVIPGTDQALCYEALEAYGQAQELCDAFDQPPDVWFSESACEYAAEDGYDNTEFYQCLVGYFSDDDAGLVCDGPGGVTQFEDIAGPPGGCRDLYNAFEG